MEAVQGNSDNESSTDSNFEDETKDNSLNDSDSLEKENRCPGDYNSFLFFTLHALFGYATYV